MIVSDNSFCFDEKSVSSSIFWERWSFSTKSTRSQKISSPSRVTQPQLYWRPHNSPKAYKYGKRVSVAALRDRIIDALAYTYTSIHTFTPFAIKSVIYVSTNSIYRDIFVLSLSLGCIHALCIRCFIYGANIRSLHLSLFNRYRSIDRGASFTTGVQTYLRPRESGWVFLCFLLLCMDWLRWIGSWSCDFYVEDTIF